MSDHKTANSYQQQLVKWKLDFQKANTDIKDLQILRKHMNDFLEKTKKLNIRYVKSGTAIKTIMDDLQNSMMMMHHYVQSSPPLRKLLSITKPRPYVGTSAQYALELIDLDAYELQQFKRRLIIMHYKLQESPNKTSKDMLVELQKVLLLLITLDHHIKKDNNLLNVWSERTFES